MRDYGPALDLDPAEINGLIDDKKKKQTAKDNSSKGLQKLETSCKNCKVINEAKYLFTGSRGRCRRPANAR